MSVYVYASSMLGIKWLCGGGGGGGGGGGVCGGGGGGKQYIVYSIYYTVYSFY